MERHRTKVHKILLCNTAGGVSRCLYIHFTSISAEKDDAVVGREGGEEDVGLYIIIFCSSVFEGFGFLLLHSVQAIETTTYQLLTNQFGVPSSFGYLFPLISLLLRSSKKHKTDLSVPRKERGNLGIQHSRTAVIEEHPTAFCKIHQRQSSQ